MSNQSLSSSPLHYIATNGASADPSNGPIEILDSDSDEIEEFAQRGFYSILNNYPATFFKAFQNLGVKPPSIHPDQSN